MAEIIYLLEKAWLNGQLPIINGIVKNNGLYYKIEHHENQLKVAEPASFSFDFSGDCFSYINPLFEMQINKYSIYCGEGSWGSDGFIYIENTETKKLLWCIFDDINPIIKCTIFGDRLIAENNNKCLYIFNFENPERLQYLPRL